MRTAWRWADGFPQVPVGEVCAVCHDCTPLWEQSAARTIRALQLPLSDIDAAGLEDRYPGLRYLNPLVVMNISRLQAQVSRIKRISGLYAATFKKLTTFGVPIPFVGTAAFASNVVRWEVEQMVASYTQLVYDMERRRQRSDMYFPATAFRDTLSKVIAGNAVVFVEIFAIFDMCVRHFQRFGPPRNEDDIAEFSDCLRAFIEWWDRVQPGSRMNDVLRDIEVDGQGLVHKGIMDSIRAASTPERLSASVDQLLRNEQQFTLQRYMYDLIDIGPVDAMEIGLWLRGYEASAKFTYEADDPVPQRFVVPYGGGAGLTEAGVRYPYTIEVVTRFDSLYFGEEEDRDALQAYHGRMEADARGY
ncbi:MAG: hypothetical protein AAFY49_09060 [Pseudomonadota bacterium]